MPPVVVDTSCPSSDACNVYAVDEDLTGISLTLPVLSKTPPPAIKLFCTLTLPVDVILARSTPPTPKLVKAQFRYC